MGTSVLRVQCVCVWGGSSYSTRRAILIRREQLHLVEGEVFLSCLRSRC